MKRFLFVLALPFHVQCMCPFTGGEGAVSISDRRLQNYAQYTSVPVNYTAVEEDIIAALTDSKSFWPAGLISS